MVSLWSGILIELMMKKAGEQIRLKFVTLTFDNGPTVETTPFVLSELEKRNIPAYFCVVGSQLSASNEQADITLETMRLGHQIVNHSLTHKMPLGDEPSEAYAQQEIVQMDQLMTATLGSWGDKWFRPFGGGGKLGRHLFSQHALKKLKVLDYSVLLWNCVPRDWVDPEGWTNSALREIDALEHPVVVLHDLNTGAMRALPKFLDDLLDKEMQFTLDLPESCVPFRRGIEFSREAIMQYVRPTVLPGFAHIAHT